MGSQDIARLIDLGELCFKHEVSASVLLKASCALLDSHLTLTREVLFKNIQAGHQWPFLNALVIQHLPRSVRIAKDALAAVLNRIEIYPEETVGSGGSFLVCQQRLLTTHAHSPISSTTSQLNPDDAAAFLAGRKQLLNWNPSSAETVTENGKEMRVVQLHVYTAVMLEWRCGMLEADMASVRVK